MVDIVSRAGWGARSPKGSFGIAMPTDGLFLHHTAGSESGAEGMRRIQDFHQNSRGWSDIGYSFVYCPDTRQWFEGRGAGVQGAHTEGHNDDHGLCVMGNFDRETPDSRTLDDIAGMVAYGRTQGWWSGGITGGHRDVGSTSCPGDNLYRNIDVINEGAEMAFSAHEEKTLKDLVAALDEVGSNGWALKVLVEHVRNHPSGGGLSEADVRRLIAGTELRP